PLGGGDDHRAGPVGDEAAVEQPERVRDQARVEVLLHRQRRALLSAGVARGVLAEADGDVAEVLLGRAVERHVTAGAEGVGGGLAEVAELGPELAVLLSTGRRLTPSRF